MDFNFEIFNEFAFGFWPGVGLVLVVGFLVGYLSSFLGLGGGFIYTPFFHTFFHLSAVQAVAVSLAQMPLSAFSGLYVYFKNQKIRFREGFLLLCTSIPSAQFVAYKFGRFEDTELGKSIYYGIPLSEFVYLIVFTVFLGILGIYNLVKSVRSKKSKIALPDQQSKNQSSQRSSQRYPEILILLSMGILFGLFSSLFGIGGGFLAVPLFVYYFRMEPVEAVATSFLGIFITSFGTSILFYLQGKLYLDLAIVGSIGGFFGARIGSLKAIKTEPYKILLVTGVFQILVVIFYILKKLPG